MPNPYSTGGSRFGNRSMLEAVRLCEKMAVAELNRSYPESNRTGTTGSIRGLGEYRAHYPGWESNYDVGDTPEWIHTKATENVPGFSPWCLTGAWSL